MTDHVLSTYVHTSKIKVTLRECYHLQPGQSCNYSNFVKTLWAHVKCKDFARSSWICVDKKLSATTSNSSSILIKYLADRRSRRHRPGKNIIALLPLAAGDSSNLRRSRAVLHWTISSVCLSLAGSDKSILSVCRKDVYVFV